MRSLELSPLVLVPELLDASVGLEATAAVLPPSVEVTPPDGGFPSVVLLRVVGGVA